MKQMYYTWCEAGKGLEADASGFQPRAASVGMDSGILKAAATCARYELPAGMTSDAAMGAPKRLALLAMPETGRLLCQSVWIGHDAASGQEDDYFTHIVLGLPSSVDAQQAIQTWGSPHWQREDDGGGTELPEMLSLPSADRLNDATLAKFLDQPAHRDWLAFLLMALLAPQPRRQLFLAAPADAVAMCLYGVARALPPTMLEDLTFSTYEREPLSSTARITGSCWAETAGMDLPDACYGSAHAAFNTFSGRKTELPAIAFAEFAVEALASDKLAALDEFRSTWQRLGIKDVSLMDLIFRMSRGASKLTKEESQAVLHNAAAAAWVATRNDALQQFLAWAMDDATYATADFSRVIVALRQRPDALAKLAQTAQDQGLAAVKAGETTRARNALETILPMISPAKGNSVWEELLAHLPDPEALTWEMRWYLLPKFVSLRRLHEGQTIDPGIGKWLRVPAVQLSALLALDLPQTYQLVACHECLAGDEETSTILAQALAAHPALVVPLLQQVAIGPKGEQHAGQLFDAVRTEASQHPWAEELLQGPGAGTLPVALLDRCMSSVLIAEKVDAARLVRSCGATLLTRLAGQKSLDRIADLFLSQPPNDLLTDPDLVAFLQKLSESGSVSSAVRGRLDAALALEEFVRRPTLAPEALAKTAAALALEPPLAPPAIRQRIIERIAAQLGAKAGDAEVQNDVENVLLTLGPQSEGGPATLYRELVQLQPDAKLLGRQNELAHAFLAVALGATHSPELAHQLDNLEGDAYSLAAQLARRGRKKALAKMDAKTVNWPKTARTHWGFLVKAVQPRGWRGVGRDALIFLAGLVVGGIVVVVLKAMGVWSF